MSHAFALVNTFAACWADSLIRACWQGGLVIALVWTACRLWPTLPPVARCWLWRLAYAKLLLGLVWLPPLTLPLLPRPAAPPPAPAFVRQELPAPVAAADVSPPQAMPTTLPPSAMSLPPPAVIAPPPPAPHPILPTLQTLLLTAWLLGVFASLGRVAAAWRRALTLSGASTPIADDALRADAADLCRRLSLRRVPLLRVADCLPSPLLLGLGRPVVLLPAFVLSGTPRAEVKLMLAHELAHLARRDLLWDVLPHLAQRVFFFHPLVWLAGHEWALAQEIACDALAVRATGAPPSAYGRMLLGIATRRRSSPAPLFPTLAIAAPRHTLRRRLFAMQHIGTSSRPRLILAAALTATLAVTGLVPWRVVAQSGAPLPTPPVIIEGKSVLQQYDRRQQADTASKNAQLDAQIAEFQKHLPAAQSKTALAYIRWINADYAANQQSVQLSQLQRTDYIAARPISLTRAQIALVEKAIVDQRNHKRISRDVRARLAAIPAEQRNRVAALRDYDLRVIFARQRAPVEKEANVFQLRTEYGASKRRVGKSLRQPQTGGATGASPAPAQASAASYGTADSGGPPRPHLAQSVRDMAAGQATTARGQVSPIVAGALDNEIAQREQQQRLWERDGNRMTAILGCLSSDRLATPRELTAARLDAASKKERVDAWLSREKPVTTYLKARRAGKAWAQASIASPEFSPRMNAQQLANLRHFEQQAQQGYPYAEMYVYTLYTKLTIQQMRHKVLDTRPPRVIH